MTTSLVEAALEAALLTGAVALEHFETHRKSRSLSVETKRDGSPVSNADREAEAAARAWIGAHFPKDGVWGEELGRSNPERARLWLVDPIDGTKSFLAGVPLWGCLIAVCEGDEVLAGAATFPATGEAIAASRDGTLLVRGAAGGVSSVAAVADALVLTTDERFQDAPHCREPFRALAAEARLARTWGDAFGYFLVATGRAELMTDGKLSPWDAACFLPIIEAAGGVFTDWRGERSAMGEHGAIATNASLAVSLRQALSVPTEAISRRMGGPDR